MTALWERYEPIVVGIRENVEKPPKGMMFEWFEDLYYAMKESRLEDHKVFDARLSERRARRMALGLNPIG